MDKNRLEAFSDGVFAFAATLLVLNISVPTDRSLSAVQLWHELGSHWPDYISYFTSFLVITIMWTNHHALFERIEKIDRHTILFNMLLLMMIVLVPFSTALLSKYPSLAPAAFVYGLVLTLCSVSFNAFWWHLLVTPESNNFSPHERRSNSVRYLIGLGVYCSAMIVALFSPLISTVAYLGITLFYLIPGGIDRPAVHNEV